VANRLDSKNIVEAKRFRNPNDPFEIVIVRDMWLTGARHLHRERRHGTDSHLPG